MKTIYKFAAIILLFIFIAGCGETVRGVGKDASRIWYGTKTIFISQN